MTFTASIGPAAPEKQRLRSMAQGMTRYPPHTVGRQNNCFGGCVTAVSSRAHAR